MSDRNVRHPFVWTILYLPYGAMSGFVGVALVYIASQRGISITETAFIAAAQIISQWLKWIWAPAVDVTLTPKRWYMIGVITSAFGVLGMTVAPITHDTLPMFLALITVASLMRSFVGMSIEAMVAAITPKDELGRAGAWFQVGNLGGGGLGGGLGLLLLERLQEQWMAGAILGALFLCCGLALLAVPSMPAHRAVGGPLRAMRNVFRDIGQLARTKSGLLVAVLCFLPFGTGAAAGVLNQAQIASVWHATSDHVALVSGFLSSGVVAVGCLAGGWFCTRVHPRPAYVVLVSLNAGVAIAMALLPTTPFMYVALGLVYAFVIGAVYAGWTAAVLDAMGVASAATKYTLFASLANFPIWWLGLLLGGVAQRYGAVAMLWAEGVIGVVAAGAFLGLSAWIRRSRLRDELGGATPAEPGPAAQAS